MIDELIRNVRVQDSVILGEQLTPLRVKVVTYMVGTQGPFTLTYPSAEFTAERVREDMHKEVETLRAIGALPPAAP